MVEQITAPTSPILWQKRKSNESELAKDHPDVAAAMLKRLQAYRRLRIDGVPDILEGKKDFRGA